MISLKNTVHCLVGAPHHISDAYKLFASKLLLQINNLSKLTLKKKKKVPRLYSASLYHLHILEAKTPYTRGFMRTHVTCVLERGVLGVVFLRSAGQSLPAPVGSNRLSPFNRPC